MFEKKNIHYKIVLYSLLMLALCLLQSVPALGLRFRGVSPELLLALSVCVAFLESETFAAFFGLAAGLLTDVITGGVMGKSALIFMFAAYFIGVLLRTLLRNLFLTYVLTLLLTCAAVLLTEYIFAALFFDYASFPHALLHSILPKFLLTGVLGYPVFFIAKQLHYLSERSGDL